MKTKSFFWLVFISVTLAVTVTCWQMSRPVAPTAAADLNALNARKKLVVQKTAATVALTPKTSRKEKQRGRSHVSPDKLSPAIVQVINTALSRRERNSALNGLTGDLSPDDVKELSLFLREPGSADETAFEQALKNGIMDTLCELNAPGLQDLLTQIFQDKSQNDVIRDYALQHLIESSLRQAESGGKDGSETIAPLLWQAVQETDGSIAGTALLGLSRLSDTQPDFDRDRVAATATQMAGDPATGQFTRITALQVCARMGVTNALPAIWQAAKSDGALPLQISAIGALGMMGDTSARPFLNEILAGDANYLKPAANQALLQIAKLETQKAAAVEEQLRMQQVKVLNEKRIRDHSGNL